MPPDSLKIATDAYYWKPAKALFEAVEVEQYARAKVRFAHPVLDLGCGDGTFSAMLRSRGVLDAVDVALEYSRPSLVHGQQQTTWGTIQADARALPLRPRSITSVLANGTLSAVRADVDLAIREVHRVLTDQGLLVLSVATPRFAQDLWLPKLLRKVGAAQLSRRLLARGRQRLEHYQVADEEEWRRKLEASHFQIEQVRHYHTPRQAFWFNFLLLHVVRVFAVVKILRLRGVQQRVARVLERMFRSFFEAEVLPPQADTKEQAGMLLVVARKIFVEAAPETT
jgi:ubiquinone/menaquinone biosynthesis C-methylase UbiE